MREALEKLAMEQRANPSNDDNDLPPFLRQFVDRGKLEGKLEGKAEGKLEGELKGKRETLLHLLSRSGIAPTAEQQRRIEECTDTATLDRWIDNLFSRKTGADVFA